MITTDDYSGLAEWIKGADHEKKIDPAGGRKPTIEEAHKALRMNNITLILPPLPEGAIDYKIYRNVQSAIIPERKMKSRKWYRRRNKAYFRSNRQKWRMGNGGEYRYSSHFVTGEIPITWA